MTLEDDDSPTMATREHLIPRVFGGPTEWWNVVAACRECNSLRGHMSALAFFWMRNTMSTETIVALRYERLMLAFERYEKKTEGSSVVVFAFLKKLFGHQPVLPVVALRREATL
jgi:hypothetical protein